MFSPDEWSGSGLDGTAYAAAELKKTLEGLARHLFGKSFVACSLSFEGMTKLILVSDKL